MASPSTLPPCISPLSNSQGLPTESHEPTDIDPQFSATLGLSTSTPTSQPTQVISDGAMESMLPFDAIMASELDLLNEIDLAINLASQDPKLLEELAELFRFEETQSMNQTVTPIEVNASDGGAFPVQHTVSSGSVHAPRNDPEPCTTGSERAPTLDLDVWDSLWAPSFSFTTEGPCPSLQFHDVGSANVDIFTPCLTLAEDTLSPFPVHKRQLSWLRWIPFLRLR